MSNKYNYAETGKSKSVSKENIEAISFKNAISLDMAQSRFFKVRLISPDDKTVSLPVNNSVVTGLLPVKNITYTMASTETMNVGVGLIKDLPIITGYRLPKISLTLVDDDLDTIEKMFRKWFDLCMPSGDVTKTNYVAYLEDIIYTLEYTSYQVDGKSNGTYTLQVMIADDFTMSRDYETNALKQMEVSLYILSSVASNFNTKTK
jgi:hypothetical protein